MAGREVELSAKEYALLVKLASDPDRVFTREQLLRDVWGFRTYVPTRTLESHASRVRRKLASAGLSGWIVNVWGVGYKLRHAAGGASSRCYVTTSAAAEHCQHDELDEPRDP